jgi:hypothetical protein
LTAAPVNCEGVGDAEVGITGTPPVGLTVAVELYGPVAEAEGRLAPYEGAAVSAPCRVKLAQPMRVLFDKWTTKERLPKYEGSPVFVDKKESTYLFRVLACWLSRRKKGANVLLRPLLGGEVAVLSTQVTRLARVGLAGVANGDFATLVRVQVSASAGAVAVGRDGLLVNVVHERTSSSGQSCERDAELDAVTLGSRDSDDGATERAAFLDGQSSDIAGASWAVCDEGRRDNSR